MDHRLLKITGITGLAVAVMVAVLFLFVDRHVSMWARHLGNGVVFDIAQTTSLVGNHTLYNVLLTLGFIIGGILALNRGLTPGVRVLLYVCVAVTTVMLVGETLEERENDSMLDVLRRQVRFALRNLSTEQMAHVVIAYEPVWAIGTGVTASNEQAQEAHAFVRALVGELYDQATADATRILYGGSVKPDNVDGLMAQPDVDGALVGGASLQAADFARIVNFKPGVWPRSDRRKK